MYPSKVLICPQGGIYSLGKIKFYHNKYCALGMVAQTPVEGILCVYYSSVIKTERVILYFKNWQSCKYTDILLETLNNLILKLNEKPPLPPNRNLAQKCFHNMVTNIQCVNLLQNHSQPNFQTRFRKDILTSKSVFYKCPGQRLGLFIRALIFYIW